MSSTKDGQPEVQTEWFRWKHYHPVEAEDPRAAFAEGWRRRGRAVLIDSTRFVQLEPLVRELLDELVQARIEREIKLSDTREAHVPCG